MADTIQQHLYSNGLVLLAEQMPHVRSATMNVLVPVGSAHDPSDKLGLASVLAEMITRGAGGRDSEAMTLALDNLGIDRGESVGLMNMWFHGGTLAKNLFEAIGLYADIIRRPQLPPDDLDAARELVLADLQSIDDSPQEMVMLELRRRFYPSPVNRDRCGTVEGLKAITHNDIVKQQAKHFRPNGTIISVAGNVDWNKLVDHVGNAFGDWQRQPESGIVLEPHSPQSGHQHKETEQTQIAMAFPSVNMTHPAYYAARGAVGVLSSGMSSRLFTEVREKRGLCYTVAATHETLKDRGSVLGYSGTRNERAQETLDVMLAEMTRLKDGIEADELDRVKAGLKTSLIMQQESTSARAGSIARDWYYLGRVRSFDELQASIDSLSAKTIMNYLDEFPLAKPVVVTLGPSPLTVPE